MEMEDLNQLETKIKNLVDNLKRLKDENNSLKLQLAQMKKEFSVNHDERIQVKNKVKTLIALIDSLESQGK
jgi:uncharacterized protein (TIGR02449 family)